MYLCRVAYHNLAPVAKISFSSGLLRNVYRYGSIRQISSGGHGGSSGENMLYVLMVGGVFAGAGLYTYKVLHADKARYNDRIAEIMQHSKNEWKPKELQSKNSDEVQSPEVVEAGEEVSAAENVEQPESPSSIEPSEEKSIVEEEVIKVLPPSTSTKDDSQTPEAVEAGDEALEMVAVEVEVPVADGVEQTENLPTAVEPHEIPSEEEAVTPAAKAQ
ncbi:protein MGARP [Pristis pectinata]|uniref:protein MGARP n=1 Tax=Pristis pectinata TaxID=685728 RepID=UPI00223E32D6|nr:protein MGARP [Pristis pectinata]